MGLSDYKEVVLFQKLFYSKVYEFFQIQVVFIISFLEVVLIPVYSC